MPERENNHENYASFAGPAGYTSVVCLSVKIGSSGYT
jgi:hypothetical protein